MNNLDQNILQICRQETVVGVALFSFSCVKCIVNLQTISSETKDSKCLPAAQYNVMKIFFCVCYQHGCRVS